MTKIEQMQLAQNKLIEAAAALVAVEAPDTDMVAEQVIKQAYLIDVLMTATGE